MEIIDCGTLVHYTQTFKAQRGSFKLEWYSDDFKSGYITALYVDKDYRKRGVGGELLKYAEGVAGYKGFDELYLKVEDGTWMKDWYERCGYSFHSYEVDEEDIWVWLKKSIKN